MKSKLRNNPVASIFRKVSAHRTARITVLAGLSAVILCMAGFLCITIWPAAGAEGADVLRHVIGEEPVARMEEIAFQVQDTINKWKYQAGMVPAAPWSVAPVTPVAVIGGEIANTVLVSSPTPESLSGGETATLQTPTATPTPAGTATPAPWIPAGMHSMGWMDGEGIWLPYISDSTGRSVAYRTFLQPDPERAYAIAAIAAFDLDRTRLHFVLGTTEPASPVKIDRPGRIPAADVAPGVLLAAFNGGFKAEHGYFGAMVNGFNVLQPLSGLGTVVMYSNGSVAIGSWGRDVQASPGMTAWRQNGPLIIDAGRINPQTDEDLPMLWGWTVDGKAATWRSAIGISADRSTLYYMAGPSLTMPALARALQNAGAYNAIQLDINNYWVYFCAVQFADKKPQGVPLFPEMNDNVNRYFYSFARDYFYITAAPE